MAKNFSNMDTMLQHLRGTLSDARQRCKRLADRARQDLQLSIGDKVLLRTSFYVANRCYGLPYKREVDPNDEEGSREGSQGHGKGRQKTQGGTPVHQAVHHAASGGPGQAERTRVRALGRPMELLWDVGRRVLLHPLAEAGSSRPGCATRRVIHRWWRLSSLKRAAV